MRPGFYFCVTAVSEIFRYTRPWIPGAAHNFLSDNRIIPKVNTRRSTSSRITNLSPHWGQRGSGGREGERTLQLFASARNSLACLAADMTRCFSTCISVPAACAITAPCSTSTSESGPPGSDMVRRRAAGGGDGCRRRAAGGWFIVEAVACGANVCCTIDF